MASIEYRKRTARVIVYGDGSKIAFSLGKVPKKTVERFANNIDDLISTRKLGLPLARQTADWLASLDDSLYQKMVDCGMAETRERTPQLAEFIGRYIATRASVTDRRRGKLRNAGDRLIAFLGDNRELGTVTPADSDAYGEHLLSRLAKATAHKEFQICRQFFRAAVRSRYITDNPFADQNIGQATNPDRMVTVSHEVTQRVIDAAPNWQWRLIIALARFGGLRCSSEVCLLKWEHINWASDRFMVTSPKTRRYGKATRITPIFPELRPYLEDARSMSPKEQEYVIPMLAGKAKNIGERCRELITRAGVTPWVKVFQNMRKSRQTELTDRFPEHVVCAWLGNSPKVARESYLTTVEDHFARAVSETGDKRGMNSLASEEKRLNAIHDTMAILAGKQGFGGFINVLQSTIVAEEGFELTLKTAGKTHTFVFSGDELGTARRLVEKLTKETPHVHAPPKNPIR